MTSSAADKKLENKLEIYKNLEFKLEIYSHFKLENKLVIFEFFCQWQNAVNIILKVNEGVFVTSYKAKTLLIGRGQKVALKQSKALGAYL